MRRPGAPKSDQVSEKSDEKLKNATNVRMFGVFRQPLIPQAAQLGHLLETVLYCRSDVHDIAIKVGWGRQRFGPLRFRCEDGHGIPQDSVGLPVQTSSFKGNGGRVRRHAGPHLVRQQMPSVPNLPDAAVLEECQRVSSRRQQISRQDRFPNRENVHASLDLLENFLERRRPLHANASSGRQKRDHPGVFDVRVERDLKLLEVGGREEKKRPL